MTGLFAEKPRDAPSCLGAMRSRLTAQLNTAAGGFRIGIAADNIKSRTGLPVEESIRMTEDRGKWRKYVHGVANPRIEDG